MIQITDTISLKPIASRDCETLFKLMQEIYPPAYSNFWTDAGSWYVNSQYSETNILKELNNTKAAYYFVLYNDEIIGNFKFIWNENLAGLAFEKQVKLHRLYLHQKTQGKGIGKSLLAWLTQKAKIKKYEVIWLDAMNEQPQAFEFYKKLGYKYHSYTLLPFELMHNEVRKMSQLYKVIS